MSDDLKARLERYRRNNLPTPGNQVGHGLIGEALARINELEAALGEICRDSNPDWTEKRRYPLDVLDDIHNIAVDAYYSRASLKEGE